MADDKEEAIRLAVEQCEQTQYMVDISAMKLSELRRCEGDLFKKELCEVETKIVKLVSKQLVIKARVKAQEKLKIYPKTEQWLRIVGVRESHRKTLLDQGHSVDSLLGLSEEDLVSLLQGLSWEAEETNHLKVALRNLNSWTDRQLRGDTTGAHDVDLHWSTFRSGSSAAGGDMSSSHLLHHPQRPSTSSLPPDNYLAANTLPSSPPLSTPTSPAAYYANSESNNRRPSPPPTPKSAAKGGKFPTTPPPHKRNKLYPEAFPLIKSKSHESQLSSKVTQDVDISRHLKHKPSNLSIAASCETINYNTLRKRSTEESEPANHVSATWAGQSSPLLMSPKRSPPTYAADSHPNKKNHLIVPMSPNTQKLPGVGVMMHSISHKFHSGFMFGTCDACGKPVIKAKICKYCKMKFHRDCAQKAPPSCGLPDSYLDFFLREGSPTTSRIAFPNRAVTDTQSLHGGDTSSSCNSSTPSSPPSPYFSASPSIRITSESTQFKFPDPWVVIDFIPDTNAVLVRTIDSVSSTPSIASLAYSKNADITSTSTSNDSDRSDKTLVDTGSSSERTSHIERVDSQESEEGQSWLRVNSISVTLKEWDIPYSELHKERCIGTGRFGNVYKGLWHGEVAIKELPMDPNYDNQAQLLTFKLEVATLRKTRHENLVLFMGACMEPPHLAIIMSLCKGSTLFSLLHVLKEKFPLNKSVIVASQIAQGMGYLHSRGIFHKDLKSKNIFLENGKVLISDFGLFSVTRICQNSRHDQSLCIPSGWLCYLSPEIIRSLRVGNQLDMSLPFSKASDVYAFGTVWYELICFELPFKGQPAESVVWQVGKGLKQSLGFIQSSSDVKDILMLCWSFKAEDRPDFSQLLEMLDKLPKKRLARSPSQPIQLSRSVESVLIKK